MKAVMISIRPEWCEKILRGEKTVEVRKTRPKLKTPFKAYIYMTQGNASYPVTLNGVPYTCNLNGGQVVVGEFTCDYIKKYGVKEPPAVWYELMKSSCLTGLQIEGYGGKKPLYGWHISDLKVYEKPKKIYDFYKPGAPGPEELEENLCAYCEKTDYGEHKNYGTPNGPVMCEGAWCGEAYEEYLDQNFMLNRPPQSWCYVEELSNGI